ncbi:MAG: hypothetical protein PHS14_02280 [Elusimicrobia bacterium]|nr:hypothetical protein [Elusimicrobiota bacterium]
MKGAPRARADWLLIGAAALLGAAPFLLSVPFCGLYLDDFTFLRMLEGASPRDLWIAFLHYVPGRNLHIPFFYGLIQLTGGSVGAMHLVGLAFDALNAALLFPLVRRLTGLRSVALAAAAVFAVAPNHGETHFWITLIPQCQIPTALTLTAFLLATRGGLLSACAVYTVALFTYDQVFFLWPLLLAVAWNRDHAPRRAPYAAAAAGLLAMNATHIALRYLSPSASGGRPLIRVGDFFLRCRDAVVALGKGVLPWPTSSHAHWAWTLPAIALALAAAVWLFRVVRAQARNEAGAFTAWTRGSGWLAAAAGGAAWTVLSYGPNLFWYLSPRHNLLPSAGWSLTLVSAGAYAASRSRRAASLLPWLAGLFFAAAVVSDFHEGTQWVDSRLLREGFESAVLRLPSPVDSVFLVGAPRYLRRAPAFNLPNDVGGAAGRVLRCPLYNSDTKVSPTRRGVVFANDLTLLPAEAFRWIPAADVNLLSFDTSKLSFSCVSALRVERPDGQSQYLPLRPNEDCSLVLPAEADAFLLASVPSPPARGRADAPHAGGLALLGAAASTTGETTALEFEWRVETPPHSTLAFIPRLKDASGNLLLDSVFSSHGAKRPYPMIWPLIDDLAFGLHLKPGQTLRQTFLLRRASKALAPGAVLELDAFEIAPAGNAVPLGRVTAPLSFKR